MTKLYSPKDAKRYKKLAEDYNAEVFDDTNYASKVIHHTFNMMKSIESAYNIKLKDYDPIMNLQESLL